MGKSRSGTIARALSSVMGFFKRARKSEGRKAAATETRPQAQPMVSEALEDRVFLTGTPAQFYVPTPLVSSTATIPAAYTDTAVADAWGLAINTKDESLWVAGDANGQAEAFSGLGRPTATKLNIAVPRGVTGPSAPTSVVYNDGLSFPVSNGRRSAPAQMLFCTQEGTIVGWNRNVDPNNAFVVADTNRSRSPAVFKGMALVTIGLTRYLYATDFRNARVVIMDSHYNVMPNRGAFYDSHIPRGYAPFGIQVLNGNVYVSYAAQNPEKQDYIKGKGNGYVDVYTMTGQLQSRLLMHGVLNGPYGMAISTWDFGGNTGDLLVANAGDGTISAFDSHNGHWHGYLKGADGNPLHIDGVWSLVFGDASRGLPDNVLYYTAGPNVGADGVLGQIVGARASH